MKKDFIDQKKAYWEAAQKDMEEIVKMHLTENDKNRVGGDFK